MFIRSSLSAGILGTFTDFDTVLTIVGSTSGEIDVYTGVSCMATCTSDTDVIEMLGESKSERGAVFDVKLWTTDVCFVESSKLATNMDVFSVLGSKEVLLLFLPNSDCDGAFVVSCISLDLVTDIRLLVLFTLTDDVLI